MSSATSAPSAPSAPSIKFINDDKLNRNTLELRNLPIGWVGDVGIDAAFVMAEAEKKSKLIAAAKDELEHIVQPVTWTLEDVLVRLGVLGYRQHASAFREAKVRGKVLVRMKRVDFEILGVSEEEQHYIQEDVKRLMIYTDCEVGPVRSICMTIMNSPKELEAISLCGVDLSGKYLNEGAIHPLKLLREGLRFNSACISLELVRCNITADGARELATLLDKEAQGFDVYEEPALEWSDDEAEPVDRYGRPLDAKYVTKMKKRRAQVRKRKQDEFDERHNRRVEQRRKKRVLQCFDVSNNHICRGDKEEKGVKALCQAIARHGNIQKLNLSRNYIKDTGAMAIGDLLQADSSEKRRATGDETLQILDVSGNCFTSESCLYMLTSAGGFVEEINMSKNYMFSSKEKAALMQRAEEKQIELTLDTT